MNKHYKTAIASLIALGLSGCSILPNKGKDLEDRVSHIKTAPVVAQRPAEVHQDILYKGQSEQRVAAEDMSDSGKMIITLALGASYSNGGSFTQEDGRWVYKDKDRMVTYEEFTPAEGGKPRFRIRYTPISEKEQKAVSKLNGKLNSFFKP